MNEPAESPAPPDGGRTDILIVLLLLQAVVGLVSLLGLLVAGLAAGFPVITPAGAIVLAGFVAPLVLAAGVARDRRWATRAAFAYETLALLSVAVNVLLALSPDVQMELSLTGLLTGIALPVAVIGLVTRLPPVAAAPVVTRSPRGRATAATGARSALTSPGG